MLDKFEIRKNEDDSFSVKSRISGNEAIIHAATPEDPEDVLLWTILNDLYEEGHVNKLEE